MTYPCEYCGTLVAHAEVFARLGVAPCCSACAEGLKLGLILFGALVALVPTIVVIAFLVI